MSSFIPVIARMGCARAVARMVHSRRDEAIQLIKNEKLDRQARFPSLAMTIQG